ncbi:MAG: C4-dicarboxylate ABC transporter [Ahrensia sp.]|nr:C4-dicarboxylate ABC transporter [Ahrensia sp.]|tara:strand:- start:37315 stop:38298 length:984 start_codon:yes stop_codon:yes gene_type:complete
MNWMNLKSLTIAGAMVVGLGASALAQDKIELIFPDVNPPDVPRSVAMTEIFAKEIGDEFDFKPYFSGTLVKQGTELVSLQRGNAQLALLPPSDFANQVPAFDILGAAYVIRDAEHLQNVFDSDVGEAFAEMARKELGVEILGVAYYGTRHVNLRGDKKINTPKDMEGIKLRMPGGESWQFLGASLGANPVPIPYTETYTALQTGVIDGQDNPLPNDKAMKFYEVTDQIVLTGHNVGFGILVMSSDVFDKLTDEQKDRVKAAARKAFASSTEEYLKQEQELVDFFKGEGLDIYKPDVKAFQDFAQEKYKSSPLSKSWPEGMLDKINAL